MPKTKEKLVLWCDEDEVYFSADGDETTDESCARDFSNLTDAVRIRDKSLVEEKTRKAWRYKTIMLISEWDVEIKSKINPTGRRKSPEELKKITQDVIALWAFGASVFSCFLLLLVLYVLSNNTFCT